MTVVSIFGGSDIIVPEGVHVELSSFALFGGDKLKLAGRSRRPGRRSCTCAACRSSGAPTSRPSAGARAAGCPALPPLP